LLQRIRESAAGQYLYARLMLLRSGISRRRGRQLEWATQLLRGLRFATARRMRAAGLEGVHRLIDECCSADGRLLPVSANRLLREFRDTEEARQIRSTWSAIALADRVRMRWPREDPDPERQGDLMLLKRYNAASAEKGVLLISYTEAVRRFAALFDIAALAQRYSIVVEPSWWGYEDPTFLFLVGADLDVIIQSSWRRDFDFIAALETNLVPLRLGAGQWMDPRLFRPGETADRTYDVSMVSAWSPYKRHFEMFQTLAALKRRGRKLKAVLIGYPDEWTRAHIEQLITEHDVSDCCTIFEGIPHAEVARLVADSRSHALLSRREGSNRAIYEALFCDTPIIVYRNHFGVNTDHVNERTGVLYDDGHLADAILEILDGAHAWQPREWALENAGYERATHILNDALRGSAAARGASWTTDIVSKLNGPNPRYAVKGQYREFDADYESLQQYLLPAART
jgi:glycosyltransferase involved in cell wall biosynthesis